MIEFLESRQLLSSTWFVAPGGADGNPGTLARPFATIQHAASLAQPGDTVFIRGGVYHETVTPAKSGTATAPITFAAYGNETVTVDGADRVGGWTKQSGSNGIYYASQPWTLGEGQNQVFVNGAAMNEAQWPNTAVGAVQPATASISSAYSSAIGPGWDYSDTATISVSSLPGGLGAWNGATIHFGAGQAWTIQTGTVLNSGNGKLTFAYQHQTSYETPVAGNHFYLTGKYLGLDAAGEWYRDSSTGRLYLWTPTGASPANYTVEAKRRLYAFDLSGRSYLNLNNIHIVAATIRTDAASSHLSINGLKASYVSQQMLNPIGWIDGADTGIIVQGSHNLLQNCTITNSSGNGIYLGGSYNTVQNCTIANTDYSGADEAAILVTGSNNQVLSSTIHDTGRDGLRDSNAIAANIQYNTIYNVGHQTTDLGAIYDYGTDSHGTVLAYNKISSVRAGGFGAAAIYLDNGSADYVVHHNSISNCQINIKLNAPSYSNSVYDNTINGTLVKSQSSGGGSPAGSAVTYKAAASSLTVLGTFGGFRSNGSGLNNSGQVVGASLTGHSQTGFRYGSGVMSPINPFGTAGEGSANAINANGQIAADVSANGHSIAYLYSGGTLKPLGALPGDQNSHAAAINSSGQIAGVSYGPGGIGHAFLYSGGAMHSLGTLGGNVSQAFGINDNGIVVGESTLGDNLNARAAAWANGTVTNLGTLGGSSSYALAINRTGLIVGASLISGNGAFHAFLYTAGKMRDLGTLSGYKNTIATGINSAGDVVGYAYNLDTGATRAFLYRNGVMTDLNSLAPAGAGWTLQDAMGINDNRQITGSAGAADLRGRAYLLTLLG